MYEVVAMGQYQYGTVDRWLWEQPSTSAITAPHDHVDMDTRQLCDAVSIIRGIARYATSRSGCGDNTNVYSEDGATQKRMDCEWCVCRSDTVFFGTSGHGRMTSCVATAAEDYWSMSGSLMTNTWCGSMRGGASIVGIGWIDSYW